MIIGVASKDGVRGGVVRAMFMLGGRSRAGRAEGRTLGDAGKREWDRIALDPWGRFAIRCAGFFHS